MSAQTLSTEAIVLTKHASGDDFQNFALFSPEHGALTVLQRIVCKPNPTAPALDLFDEVTVLLETSNQGRTYFIREARIVRRRAEIGRDYDTLRFACAFAAVIARNPVDEESRPGLGRLLQTAFDAFGAHQRPDIVYLKSVYRFARDEGYPLKEEWFPTLPASDRAAVTTLLNRPVAEQTADAETVARLQRRLDAYLRGHTEIVLPD